MSREVELRLETRNAELDYVKEIHKDMLEHEKHFYTASYEFANKDRVKITIERL